MLSNKTTPITEPNASDHTKEQGEGQRLRAPPNKQRGQLRSRPAQRDNYRQRSQRPGSQQRKFNPQARYSDQDPDKKQRRDSRTAQDWRSTAKRGSSYSRTRPSSNYRQDNKASDEPGFRHQGGLGQRGDRRPRSGGDKNYGGNRRYQDSPGGSFKSRYSQRGPYRQDGDRERTSYQHRDRRPRSDGDKNYGGSRRYQDSPGSSFKSRHSQRGPYRQDGDRERTSYQHRDRRPRSGGDKNYGGSRRFQDSPGGSFKARHSQRGPYRQDGDRERTSYQHRDRHPRSGGDKNYGGNRRYQDSSGGSFKSRYSQRGPHRQDGDRERTPYQHRDRRPRSGGAKNYGGSRRYQDSPRGSFKSRQSQREPHRQDPGGDRSEHTKDFQEQRQVDSEKISQEYATDSNTELDTDKVKVHKTIASSGLMSRRNAEEMIEQGRVSVAGNVVKLGDRFSKDQKILFDGEAVVPAPTGEAQLLIYNKPRGQIVSSSGSMTVFENLPPLAIGRWVNIGRLDVNSEGLLLFTTDGDLANCLAHPRFGYEREYAVRAAAVIPTESMNQAVDKGLAIAGEIVRPLRFTMRPFRQATNQWYEIVLNQGRNRVVRRLFEALGTSVNRLIRVRFGDYSLPQDLEPGDWRMVPLPKNLEES